MPRGWGRALQEVCAELLIGKYTRVDPSAEIMINLVSALRAEEHSKKCATCGMAFARFYNITAALDGHVKNEPGR